MQHSIKNSQNIENESLPKAPREIKQTIDSKDQISDMYFRKSMKKELKGEMETCTSKLESLSLKKEF